MTDEGVSKLPWDLIRAFLALDRHGDYAVAAEMERIDDSTLRRRIRTLEQRMGRALFVRTERGWKAAPDQLELVRAAQRMDEAARCFSRPHQEETGVISITMLDAFAHLFSDVFGNFQRKYPRIILNITTESHFVDLEQEQVDIAIRLARPLRSGATLRICKIGDLQINAYASQAYLTRLEEHGLNPATARHRLLAMNLRFSHSDHNFAYGELSWDDLGLSGDVAVWSDSMLMLARMCEQGQGAAIMPAIIASDYRDLRPVCPDRPGPVGELWMISRFDLRAPWQRDLADMLRAALSARQGEREMSV
ncbi:LysR family transcriptional regulator [Thauera sp. 2A1]|uniref:LysR family transcriptional regulator n=1 Tax=Thauera sp. 2A1 TaxID=2570191 RepID=UPI001884CB89|nr:LysR family transcriptional regulator [Thauera sp. 2A1]KAI5915411.1 LysR family transcriptional regulator [Thauera sp. 2A1]